MTTTFISRIIREVIVDTRNYRYIIRGNKIMRCPISYLDTTSALDGWTVVNTI